MGLSKNADTADAGMSDSEILTDSDSDVIVTFLSIVNYSDR